MKTVQHFFDPETSTLTYIVFDPKTKDAVVIDPVLDYDNASGKIEDRNLTQIVNYANEHKLNFHFCLETHAHADHLSSSQHLKKYFPQIKIAISENIKKVQNSFKEIYNLPKDFQTNGSQFDKLIRNNESFSAGSISIKTIPTPGHTPACLSYHIDEMIFCGDALFMEDYGTGRCDFPEGSAKALYQSVHQNLYTLPDETIVYVGHDYQPNGRELKFKTTIGISKAKNIQLKEHTTETEFIQFREARDKTLKAPKLLFPSIQVNIAAGKLPLPEENGKRYLKIPIFDKTK